jgi:hypothetical protein
METILQYVIIPLCAWCANYALLLLSAQMQFLCLAAATSCAKRRLSCARRWLRGRESAISVISLNYHLLRSQIRRVINDVLPQLRRPPPRTFGGIPSLEEALLIVHHANVSSASEFISIVSARVEYAARNAKARGAAVRYAHAYSRGENARQVHVAYKLDGHCKEPLRLSSRQMDR